MNPVTPSIATTSTRLRQGAAPGRQVNRKRIARLMRERDIRGVTRRKRRSLTRADTKAKLAPDLPCRAPGIQAGRRHHLPAHVEGRLYLACWLYLATREVVGYAMADHHRAELVTDSLDMAHGRAHWSPVVSYTAIAAASTHRPNSATGNER